MSSIDPNNIHSLDLPNLAHKPSYTELHSLVDALKVEYRNFDDIPQLQQHVVRWLGLVVSSPLDWISEEEGDTLRDAASKRLGQQAGAMARSALTRHISVGNLEIGLYEPGMTNDNIGLKTWGASLILAQRLCRDPTLIVGNAIELGSGTGLCGIVAAKVHPDKHVHMTDMEVIIPNLERNIQDNGVPNVTVGVLNWNYPQDAKLPLPKFDTIIVSDPVYAAEAPAKIISSIGFLGCPRVVLQFPLRRLYEDLREEVYQGLRGLGYQRSVYEEEEGDDDFGRSGYAFSLWLKE